MSANDKKKKDEWLKLIKNKKAVYKREYEASQLRKQQKKKRKHKRIKMKKKQQASKAKFDVSLSSSHSSNITISDSLCVSTGNESDSLNLDNAMDTIHDGIELNTKNQSHGIPPALSVLNMPKVSVRRHHCKNCFFFACC